MSKTTILGIRLDKRNQNAIYLQEILSHLLQFPDYILDRFYNLQSISGSADIFSTSSNSLSDRRLLLTYTKNSAPGRCESEQELVDIQVLQIAPYFVEFCKLLWEINR